MKTETFVALRYLKAKRKQHFIGIITFISVFGIIIGTMSLVIALSLMTGFHNKMKENLLDANSHLTVHSFENKINIKQYRELVSIAASINNFRGAAPVILTQGLLKGGVNPDPAPVVIKGVDFKKEKAVTTILNGLNIDFLEKKEIVIGSELAKRRGVFVGDKISLVFLKPVQTPMGLMPKIKYFTVKGIFSSGTYEYDKTWVFCNISAISSILGMGGDYQYIELKTKDLDDIDAFKTDLIKLLPTGFHIIDLRETNKQLFAAIKVEKIIVSFIIGLIVLVAALNITSSLVMSVIEKNRDIGILMAMGMKRKGIMKIFQLQGLVIGVSGSLIGCTLGAVASVLLDKYKVIKLPPDVYDFLSYIPFHLRISDVILIFIGTVIIAWVATIYPAKRASSLNPVEAIRHE
jgi:lipoprotein-releasing system permease protein